MTTSRRIELLGLYTTEEDDVYLIEAWIDECPRNIDLTRFTIKEKGRPETDWQVPYDEIFLDEKGTHVIGDYFNREQLPGTSTRVAFFLYIEDFSLPVSTPYGEMVLGAPTQMPERLKDIISFIPFD